jgi:hypothetical protein
VVDLKRIVAAFSEGAVSASRGQDLQYAPRNQQFAKLSVVGTAAGLNNTPCGLRINSTRAAAAALCMGLHMAFLCSSVGCVVLLRFGHCTAKHGCVCISIGCDAAAAAPQPQYLAEPSSNTDDFEGAAHLQHG